MMKTLLCLTVLGLLYTLPAAATTRYVSATGAGTYTTLNAAATAAVTGDTILVGPGTYSTATINEANKRLTYIGAGWDQTIVNMGAAQWDFNGSGANRTSIEGMRISTASYCFRGLSNVDSVTFRRCYLILTDPNRGITWTDPNVSATGRGLTIEDCIILSSQTSGYALEVTSQSYPTTIRNTVIVNQGGSTSTSVWAIEGTATSGTVELYNCVFLNWKRVLALSTAGGPVIGINNVFYDWLATPTMGSYNASSVWDYNSSHTAVAAPGTNALSFSTDPFVNYDEALNYVLGTTNLNLDPTNGAAQINSGHPSLLDFTDGSQSDRGAYGGPKPLVDNGVPNYPWAVNILLNPNLVGVGTPVNATALGRVGPQY
ncbi:hypothetical protein HZB60_12185 [candidate division KSB1 bacterium]|nr:hypothetical protein [candidate division KSB1 bacterium]